MNLTKGQIMMIHNMVNCELSNKNTVYSITELVNLKEQLTLTDVVVPKETLPNNCKGCGRTIEEMGKMTSMCGVSACPNY